MTGTALTEAEEFADIYGLQVISVPTNMQIKELIVMTKFTGLQMRNNAIIDNIISCNKKISQFLLEPSVLKSQKFYQNS